MQNIEAFNFAALEVLHCCLETFPVRANLVPKDISKLVAQFFEVPNKSEEIFAQLTNFDDICLNTIWWLRDEGFIDIKSQIMDGTCDAVLTQKGLNALNAVPSLLNNKKTFRELFYGGLTSLPINVASGAMIEFFKNGG
jgi:hypothetical protein